MKPVDPGTEFGTLHVIGKDQAEYRPLPARIPENDQAFPVMTRWQLNDDERRAIEVFLIGAPPWH